MNEELITTTEAARLLEKSPRSVQRMVAGGLLVPVRKLAGPNGAYLFNRSDIDVLVAA
jgi:predicted DNA-binding transcriptional regulator YafY